jgi:hypothetical protein
MWSAIKYMPLKKGRWKEWGGGSLSLVQTFDWIKNDEFWPEFAGLPALENWKKTTCKCVTAFTRERR